MLPGFPILPEDDSAFEGAPLAHGGAIYVASRRGGARSVAYVTCHDALTGRLKWRREVCAGETLGQGSLPEVSHQLLTLAEDTLYFNTHMGVVAALDAHDGELLWITRYPRSGRVLNPSDRVDLHTFRDLTPCLFHRDRVMVAPADCDRLFALEAATGKLLWATPPEGAVDAVHLLGVGRGNLIASGEYLHWLDADTGRMLASFPENGNLGFGRVRPEPHGCGRGVLAGGAIYWPTNNGVLVFDQALDTRLGRGQPRMRDVFHLETDGESFRGANLLAVGGFVVAATSDKLLVYQGYRADAPSGPTAGE